uniref:Uncharacterized protein n=1 Tax=Oryza brachyantha TaxID=4533 RepID=J3LRP6_ORYBR
MTKYECIDHVHYGDNLILALFLNKSSMIICETNNVGILPYPTFQSDHYKDGMKNMKVTADFICSRPAYLFQVPWPPAVLLDTC